MILSRVHVRLIRNCIFQFRSATRIPNFNQTLKMSSLPNVQKVVLIRENSDDLSALRYEEDFPVPEISQDEILIKNKYAGINFIEAYFRQGLYPSQKPYVLGREATGVVQKVGANITNYKVGDKIAYLSPNTFAQFTKIDPKVNKSIKLADNTSDETLKLYAGSLVQGLTAITFIDEAYKVQKGDNILVWAAAGGVGKILTQLISKRGANVIAVASTDDKLKLAKGLGAKYLINSKTEDVTTKVKEYTNGEGVIASFDSIGKDTFETSIDSLSRKGTLISFGNASGAVPPFSLSKLNPKNLKVLRPGVFNYIYTQEEFDHYSKSLFDLIKNGELKIDITGTYPLSEYKTAASELEGRKTTGKLILEIPQ